MQAIAAVMSKGGKKRQVQWRWLMALQYIQRCAAKAATESARPDSSESANSGKSKSTRPSSCMAAIPL
ncbi:hypothetical protein D3C72_1998280 [compost metagenome]